MKRESRIRYFNDEVLRNTPLPDRFTFPFYYEPHPLAVVAAEELMAYLAATDLQHNFGLDPALPGLAIGKMFGVLVVQDAAGKCGYLAAFSGKLAGSNRHERFVPPVFDMLAKNGFFLAEEEVLNGINATLEKLVNAPSRTKLMQRLEEIEADTALTTIRQWAKDRKEQRRLLRIRESALLSAEKYADFNAALVRESLADKREVLRATEDHRLKKQEVLDELNAVNEEIETLKKERRTRSAALQERLFQQYTFLNQYGTEKSLHAIFQDTVYGRPPAAAGECATPKLLQYAFLHGYKPLAMAEFWWGAPPPSEVRQHRTYYPACTGKCEPILRHMLEGIVMEENPLLRNEAQGKRIEFLYEDEHLAVVLKPAGMLSVPGKHIEDSVYIRLKKRWQPVEPWVVHRLDMATSGLLVVARSREAHHHLQAQFLKRTVAKRYTALLEGTVNGLEGEIELPLRGDFEDRPRQLVCFEHGKKALTRWKWIETSQGKSKVHFYPITGRTHQLRMHAAHPLGLNAPICGDDLYGKAADRLYLHAAFLAFTHPISKERMEFTKEADF